MGAGAQEPNAHKEAATAELTIRQGADGSFSLWSPRFGEGFHSRRGALREARETFLAPSQLERFSPGQRLTVVEVCVGTGTNLAALIEACTAAELELEWWGLELDPAPLQLALAEPAFRSQWHPQTLKTLETLSERGCWQQGAGSGRMLWGDARQTLPHLLEQRRGQVDLIWHDAFSPQHCPQLWTVEFLGSLAELLADGGRWISYCSAAAVREGLRLANLNVVALAAEAESVEGTEEGVERADDCLKPDPSANQRRAWSGGTLASRAALEPSTVWRQLTAMEREHLACSAGEPYRDPSGTAEAAAIQAYRREAQADSLARGERTPSSAWRRRWGL
jgi:tRNA U34 5-methylaminomethyl-2-thiouridine-forming methyltransferase MnmC